MTKQAAQPATSRHRALLGRRTSCGARVQIAEIGRSGRSRYPVSLVFCVSFRCAVSCAVEAAVIWSFGLLRLNEALDPEKHVAGCPSDLKCRGNYVVLISFDIRFC